MSMLIWVFIIWPANELNKFNQLFSTKEEISARFSVKYEKCNSLEMSVSAVVFMLYSLKFAS